MSELAGLAPHHIGVATKSIESELALFLPLGFQYEAEFSDERQGVRGVFITHKSAPYRLELLENLPHSTRLDSYLKNHHKLYHIAFETSDIEASVEAILRGDFFNSSLGNQFAQSLHPASLRRMPNTPHSQGEAIAQSNTANTRIVCGEIQDSKGISESTSSDSKLQAQHSKICDDKSGLSSERARSKVQCLESKDSQAAGFSDDFRGFQGGGEGVTSKVMTEADNAESAKSAEKPTRLYGGGGGSPMTQTTRKSTPPAHASSCQLWNLPILPSSALLCCLTACLLSLLSHIPPFKDSYAAR